jgi:hypothetical protein
VVRHEHEQRDFRALGTAYHVTGLEAPLILFFHGFLRAPAAMAHHPILYPHGTRMVGRDGPGAASIIVA